MAGIFVESVGAGDPVLFIHGLGGTSNVFGPQVGVLSRYFACHRFDLPGAGLSPDDGAASIDAMADAAITVLDQVGASGRVHVVAHSMGTVVAQHLALRVPERVRSLALIGPIHAPGEVARTGLRARAASARADGLTDIADQIAAAGLSADTKAHRPELAALVREFIMRQLPEGYARHCEALAGAEAAEVARIGVPTLLITGDEDGTSPPPAAAALTAQFAQGSLTILPATGHWATIERPGTVNGLLVNFLIGAR